MAKGKHAAALFEVIHADRRFGKKTPPSRALSTPKWWFKGKKSASDVTAATTAAAGSSSVAAPVLSEPEPLNYMPSIPAERPVDVKVNPDRQEISFKLTYTSAVVGGFALLVVLSLAYVIGRKMSAGPAGAIAGTVSPNQIRKGEPQKGVMDLAKAQRNGVRSITPDGDESANIIDPGATKRTPPTPPPLVNAAPPQPFNGKRLINQNYAIIQSFPPEEKAFAEEAVKRLAEAGIGATIEKGLSGWPPTWSIVVGTIPFERTKDNAVYNTYRDKILAVSAQYAGKSRWKKFDPQLKKWSEN